MYIVIMYTCTCKEGVIFWHQLLACCLSIMCGGFYCLCFTYMYMYKYTCRISHLIALLHVTIHVLSLHCLHNFY